MYDTLFKSYLMGGFECSTHRRRDGRRLDMIAATGHDKYARKDYKRLADLGMFTARDGLRWPLIEASPHKFDFSSVSGQIDAAQEAGVQVIWDIFHYGYPEHIDIFGSDFPARLADMGGAFADFFLSVTGEAPLINPVNEISFFSWIAGDARKFYPFGSGRGNELKTQLTAAAIAAVRAVKAAAPDALAIASEPLVHIIPRPEKAQMTGAAESYRISQYQAFDMLTGKLFPELGGGPDVIDVLGINYYPHNQWFYPDREMIPLGDPSYRPFRDLLTEIASRYELPIFISETGTESEDRARWFNYVAAECQAAREAGVDLQGICLYPFVKHPGRAQQ